MSETTNPTPETEDTEGHWRANTGKKPAGSGETEDTEGHLGAADAEPDRSADGDDTEGHLRYF
ncbi:MAG: hypothetical protein H0T66_01330 [Geodermatophilaceae bacterium]|nr:hypothetical protein [Geodermatophilaceae bacterium]